MIGIKVSTPKKDQSVNLADFNRDSICNLSRISNVTQPHCDINETGRSIRSTTGTQPILKQHMAKLNISEAKRAGLFLDGCNVSDYILIYLNL